MADRKKRPQIVEIEKQRSLSQQVLFDYIPLAFSLITLLVLLFGSPRDWSQDASSDRDRAITIRPSIKVTQPLRIYGVKSFVGQGDVRDVLQELTDLRNASSNAEEANSVMVHSLWVQFTASLYIQNEGQIPARIESISFYDSLYGDDFLRRFILVDSLREKHLRARHLNNQFSKIELKPNESTSLEIPFEIFLGKEKSRMFHILIHYSGHTGVLYDAYYWFKYTAEDLLYKANVVWKDSEAVGLYPPDGNFADAFQCDTMRSTSEFYIGDQADEILDILHNLK
jgi:hypothetical protein